MPVTHDLQGCRVLVTRPVTQAEVLCEYIIQDGGIAVQLPTLAIEAIHDPVSQQRCQSAADYDWIIFISRNAVEHGHACLPEPLPARVKVAAIGKPTAIALTESGIYVDLEAGGAGTSESLLSASAMSDMQGQRVLIMRGEGGREVLAETLRERGAQVDYANLYRRIQPPLVPGELSGLLDAGIDILTSTSAEIMDNLLAIAAEEQRDITHLPVVVMSERLLVLARERGFTDTVIIATETSDVGMVEAIRHWCEKATTEEVHDRARQ